MVIDIFIMVIFDIINLNCWIIIHLTNFIAYKYFIKFNASSNFSHFIESISFMVNIHNCYYFLSLNYDKNLANFENYFYLIDSCSKSFIAVVIRIID